MPRVGVMLAYPFEEQRLVRWNDVVIVQPKLDGERCRALIDFEVSLISSEGESKNFALPSLVESCQELFLRLGRKIELDGELYIHGESHPEIHSIVSRKTNMNPLEETMELHIFDICDETKSQLSRLRDLVQISKLFPPAIKLVPSTPAENSHEINSIFNRYLDEGYEGIIVRNIDAPYVRARTPFMMKFKPKRSDVYNIIGYVEGKGKYEGTIGAIVCCGDDGTLFEVGSFSINDQERKVLWNMRGDLASFACKVGYQHRTPKGIPKSAVFIKLVEKFNIIDVNPLL